MEIGKSVASDKDFDLKRYIGNPKILLPADGIVAAKMGDKGEIKDVSEIGREGLLLDAGPKTVELIREAAMKANTILWNGPLGGYEQGYKKYTLDLAAVIAEATTKNGAKSIIGGGDTLAAIAELGIEDKFSFVSTGGGAMLDFLANETLPGIEALEREN